MSFVATWRGEFVIHEMAHKSVQQKTLSTKLRPAVLKRNISIKYGPLNFVSDFPSVIIGSLFIGSIKRETFFSNSTL